MSPKTQSAHNHRNKGSGSTQGVEKKILISLLIEIFTEFLYKTIKYKAAKNMQVQKSRE